MAWRSRILLGMAAMAMAWVATGVSGKGYASPWTLDHFQHRGFTVNDGLPVDGTTLIAQTMDGLIWLPDVSGLLTFDGADFRPFVPLPGEHLTDDTVAAVFAPASGGLWVTHARKDFDVIRGSHVFHIPRTVGKGLRLSLLHGDRNGAVLAVAGGKQFMRFDGATWVHTALADAPDRIKAITTDSHFNVWMVGATAGEVYRRRENELAFEDMNIRVPDAFSIAVPADDIVFVASLSRRMFRFRLAAGTLVACGSPLPGLSASVLGDGRGGGWMHTVTDGVHYFPSLQALCPVPPASPDDTTYLANKASGATGDLAMTAMVDREGNIWTTSEGGLDRYTPSAFSKVRFPRAINMATIAPGTGGSIWIGNEANDVFHYSGEVAVPTDVAPTSLAMASVPGQGVVLAASLAGVWSLSPGTPRLLAPMPPSRTPNYPQAVYLTDEGQWWLAFDDGVFVRTRDTWERLAGVGKTTAIYGEGHATIWLALAAEDAFVVRGPTGSRTWTHADGVDVGAVRVIMAGPGGLWIAGEKGVQVLSGNRFRALGLEGVAQPERVTGMVLDDERNLWIHAVNGLYRVASVDVGTFASMKASSVPARVYGTGEGLPGTASQLRSLPSLVKGSDGRLWIQGGSGVAWIDPAEEVAQPSPSAPVILGLAVGGRRFDTTPGTVALARDERSPVISYTAPATTDASRVHFQTRLSGFDDGWVDQGARREVSYPRIPAGDYSFAVRSSTDGVAWAQAQSPLAIVVRPFFFETWWFKVCCVLAALMSVWALSRWQMTRALRRFRERARIRLEEREAIARDLHDTLLQSSVALVLQLEAVAQMLPEGPLRQKLATLADHATDAAREGRERVSALREGLNTGDSVSARLADLGARLGSHSGIRFQLAVTGEPRAFGSAQTEDLCLLLSEAVTNAFRHSGATNIKVAVRFTRWKLHASVSDDGSGIAPSALEESPGQGHWGVPGMHERAAQLRGRLTIRSIVPQGTEVKLDVPGRHIYLRTGVWRFVGIGLPRELRDVR